MVIGRTALVVSTGLALAACKRGKATPGEQASCTPQHARHLCDAGDLLACGWVHAVDMTAPDDATLIALLPQLGEKTLLDGEPPVPPPWVYTFEGDPPYTIDFPIDWAADPYGKRSWRSGLQNLRWLPDDFAVDGPGLDLAAYVITSWVDAALAPRAHLEWTWTDAAMAKRLQRLAAFLTAYLAHRHDLHRRVVVATVRAIASHVHAMSLAPCYSDSNHGMMLDLALIQSAGALPGLDTGPMIQERARARLVEHVEASVTDEGIHVENSPEYHGFYLMQLLDAIDLFAAAGETAPSELTNARDAMLPALVFHLQPNRTYTQFGDTGNTAARRASQIVSAARHQGSVSPALEQLDWILSDGASGRAPDELQRVYPAGGYAMFRERWSGPQDLMASVKLGRLSTIHDHADQTSFELYGRGTELVVDAGKYSYEYGDPLVKHQYDARAHNVLVVDDATFDADRTGRVIGSGDGWVRGQHTGYASIGVSVTRTFGYARPDTFVVVDRAAAAGSHDYAQHFHLHPSLSDVKIIDDRTVVALGPDGVALTLTAGEQPARIDVVRGKNDVAGVQGWYFPDWEMAIPAADVVFAYGRKQGPELVLPLVITVSKTPATAVAIDGDAVSWSRGGKAYALAF